MKKLIFGLLVLCTSQLHATELTTFIHGRVQQGEMLFGFATPGAEVFLDEKPLKVRDDGWFVFGIDRDAKKDIVLKVVKGEDQLKKVLKVKKRQWKIQKINGLPDNKVNFSEETLKRINQDNEAVYLARQKGTDHPLALCYVWPAKGRISSVYGSQRILNGSPKSPHKALDIANVAGTPVYAAADGEVLLTYEDAYLAGNTILIGHGNDVTTSYIHLSKMDVKTGDKVKRGDKIGEIGMTGRATGPHLHWTVAYKNTKIDPDRFLKNASAFCAEPAGENK